MIGLAPDRLRLWLNTGDCIEDDDSAVEHPEAALHLGGKVDVPRRIDDIDLIPAPLTANRCGLDRDAPLPFLHHPIGYRRALVNVAHPVGFSRVVQDALGRCGFARVDMSDNADIAQSPQAFFFGSWKCGRGRHDN